MRGALMQATLPLSARRMCKLRFGKTTGLRSSSPRAPSPLGRSRAIVCTRVSVSPLSILRCPSLPSLRERVSTLAHSTPLTLLVSRDIMGEPRRAVQRVP